MHEHSVTLAESVAAAWSAPRVDQIGESFVVTVPSHRYEHDSLSLVVRRDDSDDDRPWIITDDAHTAFILGDGFSPLLELLQDSPVFGGELQDNRITLRSADEAIGQSVVGFARELHGLLVSAKVLEVYTVSRRAASTAEAASRVMAKEVRSQLLRATPRLRGLYKLDRQLQYAHLKVKAPLALNTSASDRTTPSVVASMVDFGTPQAARHALGTSSLMLDVADKLRVPQRFVIVRGDSENEVGDLAELYDHDNITVTPSTDLDSMIRTVIELELELFGATSAS